MRKFISLARTAFCFAFILALRRMFITLIWEQGSYSGPSARLVVLETRRLNRLSPGTVSRVLLHTVQPNRRTLQCSLTHTQVLCFVTAHWGCVNMARSVRYGRRRRRNHKEWLPMALEWSRSAWKENLQRINSIHCRAVDSTPTLDAVIVNYSHFHAALFSWYLAVMKGQPPISLDFLPFFVIMKSRLSSWRWLFIIKSSFWQRPCLQPPAGLRSALVCRREAAFLIRLCLSVSLCEASPPAHRTHCSELCSSLPARKPAPWTALPGPRTCDEYWLWVNWPCGFLHIKMWFSSSWNSICGMQIKCGWCLWRFDWRDWCYMSMRIDHEVVMALSRPLSKAFSYWNIWESHSV